MADGLNNAGYVAYVHSMSAILCTDDFLTLYSNVCSALKQGEHQMNRQDSSVLSAPHQRSLGPNSFALQVLSSSLTSLNLSPPPVGAETTTRFFECRRKGLHRSEAHLWGQRGDNKEYILCEGDSCVTCNLV